MVLLSGLLLAAAQGPAAAEAGARTGATGALELRFVEPERYTDMGLFGSDAERNRAELAAMFEAFAQCLPAGQRLSLEVLDVDLAGENQPWRYGGEGPRVMLDRHWPRVELRYVLRGRDQAVLAEGRERVQDVNYLARSRQASFESGSLPYERAMLAAWFGARFCAQDGAGPR